MKTMPLVITLLAATTVAAAQDRPMPPRGGRFPGAELRQELRRGLFAPELVMRHQQEIGLSEDQKSKLVRAMQEMQADLVPLQFEMGEAAGKLRDALASSRIDEAKAGDLSDRLMALETKIKRRHLTAMIRIKNVLTPEQQESLRALREQEPRGRGGHRGDRPPGPPEGGDAPEDPADQ